MKSYAFNKVNHKVVGAAVVASSLSFIAVQQVGSLSSSDASRSPKNNSAKTALDFKSTASSSSHSDAIDSADTSANASGASAGHSEASVNVNGHDIAIPDNGSSQQTIKNDDGTTTVSVSHSSSSAGSTTNTSVTTTTESVTNTGSGGNVPAGSPFFDPEDFFDGGGP